MKIGVLGAGAIGSWFGGRLKCRAPQHDVVLVGRGEHARAVIQRGTLRLRAGDRCEEAAVEMSSDPAVLDGCDFVLVTTKLQATEEALQAAAPYLGHAIVLAIQNGASDELLTRYIPDDRLAVAMTAINAAILTPGEVSLQLDGITIVGRTHGPPHAAAQEAVAVLRQTDMATAVSGAMQGVRYNKLTMNAIGYASCLSRSNFITEAIAHRPWRKVVARPLLDECLHMYAWAGIELAPIPGRPDPAKLRRLLGLLDVPLLGSIISLGARRRYNRRPIVFSLQQDLTLGRKTEVDYINGQVVRLAEESKTAAPHNALVCHLAHRVENRGPGSFFSREAVIAAFARLADGAAVDEAAAAAEQE